MKSFSAFLEAFRSHAEPLETASSAAWWDANTRSDPATEANAARAQKNLARLYADRATFAELRGYADDTSLTPEETRQYTLLYNLFVGHQMDDAVLEELVDTERRVETVFNVFRPPLRGAQAGENALREILRTSDDLALRRDAWEATKAVGGIVADDVLRLVTLRNEEARRLGYPDYYHMALTLGEIEPKALFSLLDDTEAATEAPFRAYKQTLDAALALRFGIEPDSLRAHHYGDPFFQEAPAGEIDIDRYFAGKDLPALATAFFDRIGLDVRDVLGRSDLYERDGKSQHAFAVHVGRYEDVRILCNCTPTEQWMGTLLHELGHAVYDKYLGNELPFFLREVAHTLTTEAIAMLIGRFSRDAAWLSRYAGVPAEEAHAVGESARREQAAQLLILARWCLVMAHFERALYAEPGQDLNRLWWNLVERFQGIRPPDGRPALPDWAAKLHIALAPVYYHNYLLGEMLASQLLNHLQNTVINGTDPDAVVSSPRVGAYLREAVFAHGAALRWDHLTFAATGEDLNPEYFVAQLRGS